MKHTSRASVSRVNSFDHSQLTQFLLCGRPNRPQYVSRSSVRLSVRPSVRPVRVLKLKTKRRRKTKIDVNGPQGMSN